MIETLRIRNFALLEKALIDFSGGLNAITGRTGAGKSILINSLAMVLGERVDRKIVRSGTDACEVVAVFSHKLPQAAVDFLKEKDLYEDELILRRKFYARGRSRCYINDRNVPLSTLRDLGNMLVDIHSQHQHQALLKASVQGELLDRYAFCESELEEYRRLWFNKKEIEKEAKKLKSRQSRTDAEINRLRAEKAEIDSVGPEPGIDEEIEKEYRILSNIESLYSGADEIYRALYDKEDSDSEIIASYLSTMQELAEVDERLKPVCEYLRNALFAIEEAGMSLGSYVDSTEFDPGKLESVMAMRSRISDLKRRFGPDMEDVIVYRKNIEEKIDGYVNYEKQIKLLSDKLRKADGELKKAAARLSAKREKAAEKLKGEVSENLKTLGMEDARFNVVLKKLSEYGANGREKAEFFISTNLGEPEMALARIASGGEISRIMLSLKSALAHADETPLLVFDEIDAGIGATLGEKVGKKLKELAGYHQIITVTHLPQIASKADLHVKVDKKVEKGRTVTRIFSLKDKERVKELARMLGGRDDKISGMKARQILK